MVTVADEPEFMCRRRGTDEIGDKSTVTACLAENAVLSGIGKCKTNKMLLRTVLKDGEKAKKLSFNRIW